MKVKYHKYKYTPVVKQNAKASAKEGLYLVFSDGDKNYYSCYHPHPELGDVSVENFLKDPNLEKIKTLKKIALKDDLRQKIKYGKIGLTKRIHSFGQVLRSHDVSETYKMKLSPENFDFYLDLTKKIKANFPKHQVRWDFNATANQSFFKSISFDYEKFLTQNLEFIEDPTAFNPSAWSFLQQKGYRLASDFEAPKDNKAICFHYKILKLSQNLYDTSAMAHGLKYVATHSMGPLFEQYLSYQRACDFKHPLEKSGLKFEVFFKEDIFSDLFQELSVSQNEHIGLKLLERLESLSYIDMELNL